MTELTAATWLGSLLLSLCGVPLAWNAWRDARTTRGLSWVFLAMWGIGEFLMFAGLVHVVSVPVLANYLANAVIVFYVSCVKRLR